VIFSRRAGRRFAYANPGLIPPCSLVILRPRFFEVFSIDLLDRLNRSNKVGVAFLMRINAPRKEILVEN
jgi:hypothetical protein